MKRALRNKMLPTLAAVVLWAGCPAMNGLVGGTADQNAAPPAIQASNVTLQGHPSPRDLAAYYCPIVIDNPVARMTCGVALGPPPPPEQLQFQFGLTLSAHNPNNIPIPALDVLLALTLFPGQDAEGLGAICVGLCGKDSPSCTGAPAPGACTSAQSDIRRIDDFAARIPGLIAGLASGQALDELRKSTLPAGGDVQLSLSFMMGVDQALRVLQKTVTRFVNAMLQGQQAALTIPISAQGTLFVQLPVVGRMGVGFGPLQSTWDLSQAIPRP